MMKYICLVLLVLVYRTNSKPVGEPVSEAGIISAPTIVTDYSSAVKDETPKDTVSSQSTDAVKSIAPTVGKIEPTPDALPQPQPQSAVESKPEPQKDAPLQDSNSVEKKSNEEQIKDTSTTADLRSQITEVKQEVSPSSVPSEPEKIQSSPAVQDIVKSEASENVVESSTANVAISTEKDAEKKLDQEAVSSEIPKESNNQINSVSVDEPKPTEFKAEPSESVKSDIEVIGQDNKPEKLQNEPTSPNEAKVEIAPVSQASEPSKVSEEKPTETAKYEQTSQTEKLQEQEKPAQEQSAAPLPSSLPASLEEKKVEKLEEKPSETPKPVAPASAPSVLPAEDVKKTEVLQNVEEAKPASLKPAQESIKPSQAVVDVPKQEGSQKKEKVKREAKDKYDEKKATDAYEQKKSKIDGKYKICAVSESDSSNTDTSVQKEVGNKSSIESADDNSSEITKSKS